MFYIIGGVPRSGKTTVKRILAKKYGISGLGTDDLIGILQEAAPELEIKFGNKSNANREKLIPFIDSFITQTQNNFEDFVLEGDGFDFDHLSKLTENPKVKICFIGMKDINPQKKLKIIREKAVEKEWTYMHTDEELLGFLEEYKIKSVEIEKKCLELGIKYFDSSTNFDNTIEEAVNYLITN